MKQENILALGIISVGLSMWFFFVVLDQLN